ncbi:Ig-like domain-containing protein [Pseudomonas sp. NFX98]|uniref:Ig-like domain-containing protein n=1 Tax=Pseudomonas sp. NFX98 TaxID=3399122 RepID=UPI0039FC6834
MNKWPRFALNALGLTLSLTGSAFAQLTAVDPGPYTFATGKFPMWYQDSSLLKLELCQSKATSSRSPTAPGAPTYMCILNPEPGFFDDTLPIVFPDNWPPEAFWFLAETSINDVGGYGVDAYVAGIEAAFSAEDPIDGDQASFARIRLRINVPVAGTYTITHPYGVETVNVTTPGRRAINITRDIGIGAPGNFSGALNGDVGPFLQSVNGPYTEVNPETGAIETFVGDPNLTEAVKGSPNNTNFLRIVGPPGTIQTNLFTVSGKILDSRAQTPVEIGRATYRRVASGTRVEVFGKSANNSVLCFRESVALVAGPPQTPCLTGMLGDNTGQFFGHRLTGSTVPPVVVVTATDPTSTNRPTAVSSKVSDVVKVQTARYSWSNHSLLIEATSSDEVVVPDMVAQGYGRLTKSGTLQRLTVADLTQPPATVTIKSASGGSDTEPVVVVGTAPDTGENQAPISVADSGTTTAGIPVTLNLVANDNDPDNNTPLSISSLTPAVGGGSVALSSTSTVVYTPPAVVTAPLTATFTYKAQDAKGLASTTAATVTVTVNPPPNQAPVGVADSISTQGTAAVNINVLANDSDPDGNGPLAIASVTPPPAGRGTVAINGTAVTYTPPAVILLPFTTTFTYVARDSLGALSAPVTVTVQVSPPLVLEVFNVTAATVTARAGNRFTWNFTGTSSTILGNTVTIQVTTPTGLVTLGTANVAITGRWTLNVTNAVVPSVNPTATIRSTPGSVRTVNVTVQ